MSVVIAWIILGLMLGCLMFCVYQMRSCGLEKCPLTCTCIDRAYIKACHTASDINEHLPSLHDYASEILHVTECGVRTAVSSWAFAKALQRRPGSKLVQVDLGTSKEREEFARVVKEHGLNLIFYQQSDLECPLEPTHLLFIDTLHVYGQLKRELSRWHNEVSSYIVMHDTTIDEHDGEVRRSNLDVNNLSSITGIPKNELMQGLSRAIREFLEENLQWELREKKTNNNGLTILQRKRQQKY